VDDRPNAGFAAKHSRGRAMGNFHVQLPHRPKIRALFT
jgi:hypothetical protein